MFPFDWIWLLLAEEAPVTEKPPAPTMVNFPAFVHYPAPVMEKPPAPITEKTPEKQQNQRNGRYYRRKGGKGRPRRNNNGDKDLNFDAMTRLQDYETRLKNNQTQDALICKAYAMKTKVSQKNALADFMDTMSNPNLTFIAIDFEGYERSPGIVTEVGIAVYKPTTLRGMMMPFIELKHIIITENMDLKNGRYVPDHKDNFNGDVSLMMSGPCAAEAIRQVTDQHSESLDIPGSGVCLVGHGLDNDLEWLDRMGVRIEPSCTIDTQKVLGWTHGKKGLSLRNSLDLVRQPYAFLHNAGNDAYYTMILCLCLADPFYRQACGMDEKETKTWFRLRPLTKGDSYTEAKQLYSPDILGMPLRAIERQGKNPIHLCSLIGE